MYWLILRLDVDVIIGEGLLEGLLLGPLGPLLGIFNEVFDALFEVDLYTFDNDGVSSK